MDEMLKAMMGKILKPKISFRRKVLLLLSGMVLSLLLLEVGLRLGGFISSSMQEDERLRAMKRKGAYRILCLGESTTVKQYPEPLEQILNQRDIGIRFEVIDKGRVATTTIAILKELETDLDKYHPQMVVTMMGINDQRIRYYEGISESDAWIFKHCRTYRLFRILFMNYFKQFRQEDIARTKAPGLKPKSLSDHKEVVAGEESSPVRMSAKGIIQSVSESSSCRAYLEAGRTLYKQGQLSPAADAFEKAIELDPRNDEAYVGLGKVFLRRKEFLRAKELFTKGLEFNPKSSNAYAGLGWWCLNEKKFSEAETFFKKALGLNPRNQSALTGFGSLCQVQGRFPEAVDLLKKALALDPGNRFAFESLSSIYQAQGQLAEVEDLFENAIETSPANEINLIGLGRFYWVHGKLSLAENLLKKAIAISPNNSEANLELGLLHKQAGKFVEAEAFLKKAVEVDPGNSRAYYELGNFYRIQEKYAQAEGLLKKAVELNPEHDRNLAAIISLYEEIGRTDLAKEYAERAQQLRAMDYSELSVHQYHKLKTILDRRGIKLVCVQYPMRSVAPLKRIFKGEKGVTFVDNEKVFRNAVKNASYREYFRDMFAGDFGHCTQKGNELLAQNIADVIMREVFGK